MFKITNVIRHNPPALTLLLLAPLLGELVSVHQTPLEFINPLNFIILSLPYGFGALICRELLIKWKKGLFSLLLLGAAYGVYEEAIVVYSVFDPNWNELGSLARYSYFAGVNWTWGAVTIHFHTFISISASVILAELLFPEQRNQQWLSKRAFAGCFAGLLLWIPVMGLIMILDLKRPFPPFGLYGLSWLAILILGWTAFKIPSKPLRTVYLTVPKPVLFFLVGLINMPVFFLTVFTSPQQDIFPFWIIMIFLLLFDAVTVWIILRWSGNGFNWDDRHRLAFISGLLLFFIYFSFDKDLVHFTGTSFVGLATIMGLWKLWRRIKERIQTEQLTNN